MLLTMAEIVFQIVALGLEGVVVFIFHLPPGSPCQHDFCDIFLTEGIIRSKGIVIAHLAIGSGDGEFAPVDQQGIITVSERHGVEIAVGIGFLDFPGPTKGCDCG